MLEQASMTEIFGSGYLDGVETQTNLTLNDFGNMDLVKKNFESALLSHFELFLKSKKGHI